MTKQINGHQHNAERSGVDFYPTDPAWVRVLLSEVRFDGPITEACAGDGAIVDALRPHRVVASDIVDYGRGYTIRDALSIRKATNWVTNPPYSIAMELTRHALAVTVHRVAMLYRIGFLESRARHALFDEHRPERVIVVSNRMTVLGKMSQFPHVWVVWNNSVHVRQTTISWRIAV